LERTIWENGLRFGLSAGAGLLTFEIDLEDQCDRSIPQKCLNLFYFLAKSLTNKLLLFKKITRKKMF